MAKKIIAVEVAAGRKPVPAVVKAPAAPPAAVAGFPIVGIGASAGGLAAFEAFFSGMPQVGDCGMAFVLVQHLAPDHKSILSELVSRYTRLQVFVVEDGMLVRPDCVYIIPPNWDMALLNGCLHLLEQNAARGQHRPIDFFFRSLAQEQRDQAIGIVLSGTGSDGTLGLRAIKGEDGMVMAQKPETTEFDGMPASAIATGLMDYVLPPNEMASQLLNYARRTFESRTNAGPVLAPLAAEALKKIFVLLRSGTGHDFSLYKTSTIQRRIERRMAVHQIDRFEDYLRYLQRTPEEVETLFRNLLIGVTSFFRDPVAYDALADKIISRIFRDKPAGEMIRVWVPGCSTGEEAYSIAILFHEKMEEAKQSFKVQIFASDIDPRAVALARKGVYPASIAADISPEHLRKFFTRSADGDTFQINKTIRDMMIFSEHDIIKDPPFSLLDLVTCRNLLIYMGPELQKKIITLFHYALKPSGLLLLGMAESTGEVGRLFNPLERRVKLFERRKSDADTRRVLLDRIPLREKKSFGLPRSIVESAAGGKTDLRALAERTLLQQLPVVGVLVNEQGDILYLHGRTGRYLEPAPGESHMNVLKMAREGLRSELTVALNKSFRHNAVVEHKCLRVKTNGHFSVVNLAVRPVPKVDETPLYLVTLEEVPAAEKKILAKGDLLKAGAGTNRRVKALMLELKEKEDYLQSINEEMQLTNEELKASNEELQSVNEELQSTNEELETSKEESQSINEELSTVNSELQTRVSDLSRVNNDMNNLISGTGIGTIFVDHELRIQRFTPTVTRIINLIPSDIGRSVGHIVANLVGYDSLVQDVKGVLDTLVPKEVEVQGRDGAWYQLGIRPYRTSENRIEGVVITFVEITEIIKARVMQHESEDLRRLAVVVRDADDAITVQDMQGRILTWSPAAAKMFGWTEAEALKMNMRAMIAEEQREEALGIVQRLSRDEVLAPYRMRRLAKDGRVVATWITATALRNEAGVVYGISTTERLVKEPGA